MASSETPPPSTLQGLWIVPSDSSVSVEEVLLAVGGQVGHENLSNKAVVVFLKDEPRVFRLIESGVFIWESFVQVSPLSAPSTRLTVSGVPPFIPSELLENELRRRQLQFSGAVRRTSHFYPPLQGDYLSGQGAWPGQGQYDVIMCLGVTKWVQLQSGDGGVVTLFRRAYQSLSPGGLFILEPQPWSSYRHSKRASETTYRNFRSLRLRPEQFTCYLTDSVGFTSYRLITHTGNQRPIYLFHKGPTQRK